MIFSLKATPDDLIFLRSLAAERAFYYVPALPKASPCHVCILDGLSRVLLNLASLRRANGMYGIHRQRDFCNAVL
jgi:hypothetical protein